VIQVGPDIGVERMSPLNPDQYERGEIMEVTYAMSQWPSTIRVFRDDKFFANVDTPRPSQFWNEQPMAFIVAAYAYESLECQQCRCPFTSHSFYGETRSECHGITVENITLDCDCSYYSPHIKAHTVTMRVPVDNVVGYVNQLAPLEYKYL